MPSPGESTIQSELATVEFSVDSSKGGTISQTIAFESVLAKTLAEGMHNGWTCAHPTTPSTFIPEIPDAFTNYVGGSSNGNCWLEALGEGLDAEVDKWIDSYDSEADTHTYFPTIDSIISFVKGNYDCGPGWSNGMQGVTYQCAETFVNYFEQDVG